jgi:hypothetical protein
LLVIPFAWLAGRRLLDERGAGLAAWLVALHFAMPYAGTKLLIEAMAMPPLLAGIWLASYPEGRRQVAAGFAVGLACWLRFQVGVAALALAAAVGVTAWREGGGLSTMRRVGGLALGGALAVGLQGLFDLWTTGAFLGPVLRNIGANLDPPGELSRSGPFTYLGLWLLLTVPPATVVLLPALWRAGRRLPLVAWPLVAFVLFHSAVPHKEDRFMLPVLPLFLLLLAAVPAIFERATGPRWAALARWWPQTKVFLVAVHLAALVVAVSSQSQANVREAMVTLRHDHHAEAVVSLGPELQLFFLGRELPARRKPDVDAGWLTETLSGLAAAGTPANRFLGFAPDEARIHILLAALGLSCDAPQTFSGYWFDRLLSQLNPKRNRRRAPILLWTCELPAVADAGGARPSP